MRTLLVLCADERMVEGRPFLTMLYADGRMTAEKAIEGVFPEDYDRVVFVITDEADQRFHIRERLFAEMGERYPLEVVRLPEKTSGPAETAYKAIKLTNITGELAIRDSHNYIRLAFRPEGNFIAGLDLCQYEHTIDNLRAKSFIRLNEQRKVLDIVEKKFCSDIISCGLYGFANASDYVMAYEKLNDIDNPIKELYVSHMIAYLIGYSDRVFSLADVASFEDWSTPRSWSRVQRWHATCFISYDGVCGGHIPVESRTLDELRLITGHGGCIVLFTTADDVDADEIKHYFAREHIAVHAVVDRCSFSGVQTVVYDRKQLSTHALEDI